MGRQKSYRGVRAASESSIEIRFAYPDSKTEQRERIQLEPTPGNLERAFVHLSQIKYAIKQGTFDYAKTFPKSKRADLYTNRTLLYTYLKSWLVRQAHIKSGTRVFYNRIIEGQVKGSSLQEARVADLTWSMVRD